MSFHLPPMTPIALPDEASLSVRWRALAEAARAWLVAAARRVAGRRATPGPAGVSLLENGGRNDGPPDLDELWRDFNAS